MTRATMVTEFAPIVVSLAVDLPLPELMRRFVASAPPFPEATVHDLLARGASFDDVIETLTTLSPLELFTYWRDSVGALMAKAGRRRLGSGFLVGNLRMLANLFDGDPRVLAFVPFRVTLTDDAAEGSWFTAEIPGNGLRALGGTDVARAAPLIDGKLLALVRRMGIEYPDELVSPTGARDTT